MVRHLGLASGAGLLLPALHHEALVPVAVRGMKQAAFLISGVTTEQVLDIAHVVSTLRSFPLFRGSRALVATAMVAGVAASRAISIEVLVTLLLPSLFE